MTRLMKFNAIAAVALLTAQVSNATPYTDATGDIFTGPAGVWDILSVEVENDATDIMFTITLNGDPTVDNGAKYLVAIDNQAGGDTVAAGWPRQISMSSGMDYWIGSWVDGGGGAETYSYNGATWDLDNATYSLPSDIGVPVLTTSSVKLTTSLASLGLAVNDTFVFDVMTTGNNTPNGAVDALSDPNQTIADWDNPYNSTSMLTYTVIPEPASLAMMLLGVGALTMWRRHRK